MADYMGVDPEEMLFMVLVPKLEVEALFVLSGPVAPVNSPQPV
jgi:hypothetical protein